MISGSYCYNTQWRQQMRLCGMQTISKISAAEWWAARFYGIETADALIAAELDEEERNDAFASLSNEEQARYVELCEQHCPWPLQGVD